MFPMQSEASIRPNALDICIQPDEGIHLRFEAKVPDQAAEMRSVDMEFHYADAFGAGAIPDAYERLIDSAIAGWQGDGAPALASYEKGSWGPAQADDMLAGEGRHWSLGCLHDD
jgi:glucose-6-phosphate 1-dehydrogenase